MKNHYKRIIFLLVFASIIFFINTNYFFGYLNTKESLSNELWTDPSELYDWKISEYAPYKYRILFKELIFNSWLIFSNHSNNDFFILYKFWSFIFFSVSGIVFYFYLLFLKFSKNESLIGAIIYFIVPPILFAYTNPVHTTEDTLAYIVLLLGIISIERKRYLQYLIVSIVGIFIRETLLLLPFIYFFFSKDSFFRRILITSIPFIIFIFIRIFKGYSSYNIFELGFMYNLNNFTQSLIFIFLSFSIFWIPFLLSIIYKNDKVISNHLIKNICIQGRFVIILIFVTTMVGGRFNEMRLMFLAFPWVLPLGLKYYSTNIYYIKNYLSSKMFWILFFIFIISLYFIFNLNIIFKDPPVREANYSKFVFWIYVTFIYLGLFFLSIPLFLNRIKIKII